MYIPYISSEDSRGSFSSHESHTTIADAREKTIVESVNMYAHNLSDQLPGQ